MDLLNLFNECLDVIRHSYCENNFYCERDFVWTVQKLLKNHIDENKLPYKILNDFPIEIGERRSRSVDIAIIKIGIDDRDVLFRKSKAELAIEFKFEPSKMRKDEICVHKLPVVEWREVLVDIERVHRFVENKATKCSIAILVDEFGRHKTSHPIVEDSIWIDWGNCNSKNLNVSILYTEVK